MKNQKGITLIALIITILVMLILAAVTVSMTIGEDGVLTKAQDAAEKTGMAEIKERAELVKLDLNMSMDMGETVLGVKSIFLQKLAKEFGVDPKTKILGNKVIVANDKYDIIVKNDKLQFEVVKHSEYSDDSIYTSVTAENIEENGKVYLTTLKTSLTASLTKEQYVTNKIEEQQKNVTSDDKKAVVWGYLGGEGVTSLDELMCSSCNSEYEKEEIFHNKIDGWLTEPVILALYGNPTEGTITREQLYYLVFSEFTDVTGSITEGEIYYAFLRGENGGTLTEEQFINEAYSAMMSGSEKEFQKEYDNLTKGLTVTVLQNGNTVSTKTNVSLPVELDDYIVFENGTYEIIVKKGTQILSTEIIKINNIETANNPMVLTAEEAKKDWEITSGFSISKYLGNDKKVYIPAIVDSNKITYIVNNGEPFKDQKDIIEEVIIPPTVTGIGGYAFSGCSKLSKVYMPDSVQELGYGVFYDCDSLTNIDFLSKNIGHVLIVNLFAKCDGLVDIRIPDNITWIRDAFNYCTNLQKITIPNTVTQIASDAFSGCSNITFKFEARTTALPSGSDQYWGATNATIIEE